MKIKFSKLNVNLDKTGDLNKHRTIFIKALERELKTTFIYTKNLADYNCDLKLILIESGGTEELFVKNLKKLKSPYILLATNENNSLPASLEILHYLKLHHKKGEILHGETKYIAKRIKELCK